MGILNRPSEGLYSVLIVLIRALQAHGPMPQDRLKALVAPASVTDGEQVRQTINRWLSLGLFIERDGALTLIDACTTIDTDSLAGLHRLGALLREQVFSPDFNGDLLASEPSHAADFTHAVCWALAQDPFELCLGGYDRVVNPLQLKQYVQEPRALQNDTRWAGLQDWALALGLAWTSRIPRANSFMIDPAQAVADALPSLFGGVDELPQDAFFTGLATAVPVVDGGHYRVEVEARLGGEWRRPDDHQISPSLTLALLRLEAAGRLRLDQRSDARERTLLGAGFTPARSISHIVLRGEAS